MSNMIHVQQAFSSAKYILLVSSEMHQRYINLSKRDNRNYYTSYNILSKIFIFTFNLHIIIYVF